MPPNMGFYYPMQMVYDPRFAYGMIGPQMNQMTQMTQMNQPYPKTETKNNK
jgi:hypothetical protein